MKRILAVFKELQDSGQEATIIGHFSIQTGNIQEVTNIGNVHEQPENALSETDAGKNSNRATTEHDRDDAGVCRLVSASVELESDLLEVIGTWKKLPDSIRVGIMAMTKAITTCQE